MAQDTSGTSLKTSAAGNSREITFRFLCDWGDDGFSSVGQWTDESQYVKSVNGNHQSLDMRRPIAAIGRGMSDSVTVVCRNPECVGSYSGFRFSPSNSSGALYASIGGGKVHMKRAVFEIGIGGENLRQITGYIMGLTENYARKEVTFEIRDRAADAVLTRASTALQSDVTAKSYIQTLCALFDRDNVAAGDQQLDDGLVQVPYYWLEDDRVWDELGSVAEAHLGRIWFDKDGILHFDDGGGFVKPNANSYDDPTTIQDTFTVASFRECNPRYSLDSVFNHVIIEHQPRYTGYIQPIFTASEIVVLQPGESAKSYHAKFQYPVSSVTTPAADTDYVAVTPGGNDITSSMTVSVANTYAASAELSLTNGNASYPAYFTTLQVRGSPLLTQESVKYEVEDATSITRYGRRTWSIRNNPYIQSYRHVEMMGDFLLARYKDPVQVLSLRGVPGRPWLEVGDRVRVVEQLTGVSEDYFIGQINWSWRPSSSYVMDLELMRVIDIFDQSDHSNPSPYFIIGTSKYGEGAGKGILFW